MHIIFVLICYLISGVLWSAPIAVRYSEGIVRGFLVLKSVDDKILANGDLFQSSSGGKVTTRTVFRFKDGSLQDETAVFTQAKHFRLLSYHLIQRGPTFPQPMDVSTDAVTGKVTVRYKESDGKETTLDEKMALPPDLANGIVPTLLKNIDPSTPLTEVSMVVATPKPRLVKLKITPGGETSFSAGGTPQSAHRFNIRVDLGGIVGFIAPIIGKQPPDTSVWLVGGEVPGFVRSEGPMYQDAPLWRIELASPTWPQSQKQGVAK